MQMLRCGIMGLAFCAPQSACFAAVIDNVSGQKQIIETAVQGGYKPYELAVGEVFRISGKLDVRYNGREIHIEDDEEYAIWNDGSFVMQRHIAHSNGRLD